MARTRENPQFFDYFDNKPLLKKLFFRSLHLIGNVVHFFGRLFDSQNIKNMGHHLETGLDSLVFGTLLSDAHGMVFEMNEFGDVIQCLHSPDGAITLLSEAKLAQEANQSVLYLGSIFKNYLGVLILNKTDVSI